MQLEAAHDAAATSVLNSLRQIVRALRITSHSVERERGVTGAQLFVLREIALEPGCSIRRLSKRTLTDPSSVSVVVSRLVERGLVARRRSRRDARQTVLTLQARGERLLSRADEPFQVRLIGELRRLPRPRLDRLAEDLAKVVQNVGADGGPAPMFFDDAPRRKIRRAR